MYARSCSPTRSTAVIECETDTLANLYTLLSNVQRDANNLRQSVAGLLLNRRYYDHPVSGPCSSVQRTTRRKRSRKSGDELLGIIKEPGIDDERALTVDRDGVDDALGVREPSKSDAYRSTNPSRLQQVMRSKRLIGDLGALLLRHIGDDRRGLVTEQRDTDEDHRYNDGSSIEVVTRLIPRPDLNHRDCNERAEY